MWYVLNSFRDNKKGVVAFVFASMISALAVATIGGIEYAEVVAQKKKVNSESNEIALEIMRIRPESSEKAQEIAQQSVDKAFADNGKLKNITVETNFLEDEVQISIHAELETLGAQYFEGASLSIRSNAVATLRYPEIDMNIVYDNSLSMGLPFDNKETPLTTYDSGVQCYFACHMDDETVVHQPTYISKYDVLNDSMGQLMSILREYDGEDNIRTTMSRFSNDLVQEYDINSYLHKQPGSPNLHQDLSTTNTDIETSLETLLDSINTTDDIKDVVILVSDGDNRQTGRRYSTSACEALKEKDVEIYTLHMPATFKQYFNRDAIERVPFNPGQLRYYQYDQRLIKGKVVKRINFFGYTFSVYYNGIDHAEELMQSCATSKRHYTEITGPESIEKTFRSIMENQTKKHIVLRK